MRTRPPLYRNSPLARTDSAMPVLIAVVVVAAIAGFTFLAIKADGDFQAHCRQLGGHTKDLTSVGVGVSVKGKPVTTVSTTTLCLSADGRILDTE